MRPFIGMDIQEEGIRLVRLGRTKQHYQLQRYAQVDLPKGAIVAGKIARWDNVKDALRYVVNGAHAGGQKVAIAMPTHAITAKRMKLAKGLTDLGYESLLRDQLGEGYCFDFGILHSTPDEHEVLVVAVAKDYLQPYLSLLQEAGLVAARVDAESYALARLLRLWVPTSATAAVLKVDTTRATLAVFSLTDMLLNQDWPFDCRPQEALPAICLALRPFLPSLDGLYLTGVYGDLARLAFEVHESLGVPVCRVNPVDYLVVGKSLAESELRQAGDRLWVGAGLAMRGLEC